MRLFRLVGDFQELRRALAEMKETSAEEEERASYDLAVSARRFSRKAKDVVDDKLFFSATLMRAGEVDAAHRLLAEVEEEVRTEEAALIECVNEVKVARAVSRERMTRLRVARALAAAMLGATLLAFSAVGAAVAGMIAGSNEPAAAPTVEAARVDGGKVGTSSTVDRRQKQGMRKVRIAGVDLQLKLTAHELQTFEKIAAQADDDGLQGLLDLLPAGLADKIRDAITTATQAAEPATEQVEALPKVKKAGKAQKAAEEKPKADEEPAPEPSPSQSPDDQQKKGDDQEDEGDQSGGLPVAPGA